MKRTAQSLSLIIPVWNEENNITPLVKEIHRALAKNKIVYELIFIDDHSSDNSPTIIRSLGKQYPIKFYSKQGKHGKAYSLLEGFQYAKYDNLGMIDADLQYAPKYIPEMLGKIIAGADVVVANRTKYEAGKVRQVISKVYHSVFVKLLHAMDEDAQSGLKVFKKRVIAHLNFHPSPWTFDLELLVKSRNAGFKIEHINIEFKKRQAGVSKIAMVRSSIEIGLAALRLKLADTQVIPFYDDVSNQKGSGFFARGKEYQHYSDLNIKNTAFYSVVTSQYYVITGLVILLIAGLLINMKATLVSLVSILTIVYFTDLLFNFFLIYRSYFKEPAIRISKRDIIQRSDKWPSYTILCPLYKEWEVLPQFTQAMANMDYPKDKLQVMLLLEENDVETLTKVKTMNLPSYFDVIIVPDSQPKTKPKALNYGLTRASGEYAVIYDAEDIPDVLQLKKAVLAFGKAKKNIICIQAKLNFYNPTQNILTRLFAIEYSLWFNLVLTGLQSIQAPIPLGGTSNHFRTRDIIRLQRWDPFNVTEDADLGIRLMKLGYRTALINSYTMEEANSSPLNWLKQRSRWIKGYIQTYFVHMREPQAFFKGQKIHHFLSFQLIIGAKILSMLINPFMWVMTISYFAFRDTTGEFIQSLYLTPIFYMAIFSMIIGNFLYMYYYILGAAKRDQWGLIPYALLTPLYWLGMSIAAVMAVWEFIFKPHYWHKTKHGLHLAKTANDDLPQAIAVT